MTNYEEAAGRRRRSFLKTAAGAAMACVAAKGAWGERASEKSATQSAALRDVSADRGLWATWYDLPENGREAYLSWLHETYIPALLKRPGYLWAAHYSTIVVQGGPISSLIHNTDDASVPKGFRYILLIGTKDAFVLGNPLPSAIHAALPDESRKMLALRIGERVNLLTEAGRIEGRGRATYKDGPTAAPCIQIGSYNCPVEYEQDLHAGYVQVRLPAMCENASCIRTRKLSSVAGWAKHVIIYEFASQEGFNRDYTATNVKAPTGIGGQSMVSKLTHAPNGPNNALRIWSAVAKG